MSRRALIFHIRRGSMDDGPGIRTTVFFKGCPLSCIWCHNPESMRMEPELEFDPMLCVGCNGCSGTCPATVEGSCSFDREACTACGGCTSHCPGNARKVVGKRYAVEDLLQILLRDKSFYIASGGGVTFSGGEPTLHHSYLSQVLRQMKKETIHTALQTCGFFDLEIFRRDILPFLDLIYFDLKIMDPEAHKKYTGVGNELILDNFTALAPELGERLIPRVPLVPGMTATERNLSETARFLRQRGIHECDFLPYNPGGIDKRRRLGHSFSAGVPDLPMTQEQEVRLRDFFMRQLGTNQEENTCKSTFTLP